MFPQVGVSGARDIDWWPQSGHVASSPPGSGSFTETSYCFHTATAGNALERP